MHNAHPPFVPIFSSLPFVEETPELAKVTEDKGREEGPARQQEVLCIKSISLMNARHAKVRKKSVTMQD